MAGQGGGRREARERALHLLYEADRRDVDVEQVIADQVLPPDPFTAEVISGVETHRTELDGIIGRLAEGWSLERMPTMDRLVMEIGLYELAHRDDVPTAVVLNEATELANTYSTDDSGRFVNGVLAAAAAELRP
jgi:N utilization substance protein B